MGVQVVGLTPRLFARTVCSRAANKAQERTIMDENTLLKACKGTLQNTLGGKLGLRQNAPRAGEDAAFSATLPALGAVDFAAIVRRDLRPAALPLLLARIRQLEKSGRRALVCTDYISAPLAKRLRDLGVWYVDAAGNASMRDGTGFYVYANERRPAATQPAPRGQAYSEAGARALYFLARHGPKVAATYRDIQATTAVSLDKISKVFGELEARRVIAVRGRGRYEVVAADRLLDLWVDAFADRLAPELEIARCCAAEGADLAGLLRREAPALKTVTVAGEMAVDLVTGHLRATAARLYLAPEDEARTRRVLRLAPAQDGPIVLCRAFATDLADEGVTKGGLRIAHGAVLYAELMAAGDARLGEAALRLRRERLAWTL